MVPLIVLLSAVLQSTATAPDAPPANLVSNGAFDRDFTGWKETESSSDTGASAWSRSDSGGSKGSGSLELATSATADRNRFRVGQCVRIALQTDNLVFGGRIRVPADQKARGFANLEIERFETTDCSGELVPYDGLGPLTNADFWAERREIVSTADARSVRLVASATKVYEWPKGDEIGETDDGILFRAYFDDVFVGPLLPTPNEDPPPLADASKFTAVSVPSKKPRWGPHLVDPPVLTLAVLDREGRAHKQGVVAECSSLKSVRLSLALKSPYEEDDPRWYPLQPVALPGEGALGSRPTVELGLFRAGDKERRLVPIACDVGQPVGLRVLGDKTQRVGGLRDFYTCLRSTLPEDVRKNVPERPTDEELLKWPLAPGVVANPAGDYEVVARYHAPESGFWHDPVLSNTVKIKVSRQEPCPPSAAPP